MGNVVALLDDKHGEAQSLLPWYLTGRLDASDRARVEAHLADCPDCRADLEAERKLMVEWAVLPLEAEHSWLRLRERLSREEARRTGAGRRVGDGASAIHRAVRDVWRSASPGLGWALAAAQALALLLVGISAQPFSQAVSYRTLGASAAPTAGNVIVIFRPETSEQAFRETLNASHARLVDGPTAADAYLLRVPPAERAAVLNRLRQRPDIELAQPLDAGATR